jgi:renalase
MAERRQEDWRFNHGAQFFTARSRELQQLLPELLQANVVEQWQPKIVTLSHDKPAFKRLWHEPHYKSVAGMSALVKHLAKGLDVRLQTPVAGVYRHNNAWLLQDDAGGSLGLFDLVVTAIPAAQCSALLPDEFACHQQLNAVEFSPCFALMLAYEKEIAMNFAAAVVRDSPLAWLTANASPVSRVRTTTLLAHSSNQWATQNFSASKDEVQHTLLEALTDLCGDKVANPNHMDLQRWRYARVEQALDEDYLLDADNGLAACGDWCRGNRVEDAFLSGLALAGAIKSETQG